ncbi:hypothetical protein LEMLEM_LOCUS14943 [Lemmus lemmus]
MMNYDSAFETPLSSNLIGFSSPEERQWGNKWNCIAQVRRSPSEFAVCSILVYITGIGRGPASAFLRSFHRTALAAPGRGG